MIIEKEKEEKLEQKHDEMKRIYESIKFNPNLKNQKI